MTISFYKGLPRNPEIGNTPVWVWVKIWRLGRARNTKCCTNVSIKMLLNAAKCQSYSFYRFWVNKGKLTGGGGVNRWKLIWIKFNFLTFKTGWNFCVGFFLKFNVNNFPTNSYCRVTCFWWVINLEILFFIFTVDLLVI